MVESQEYVDLPPPNFKQKIDMSYIWLMHVNRTNQSIADINYDPNVRQLLRLLPLNMQTWVLSQKGAYTEPVEEFVYEKDFGRKRGNLKDPILWDKTQPVQRLEDGTIDWDDPNIRSPKKVITDRIDYERYNLLIMAAAEKAGLSWKLEQHTYDMGDVDKTKKKPNQPPLPLQKTDTGHIYANIPIGYSTRIISEIADHPGYNVIDWHGTKLVEGTGYGPLFLNLIQARTNAGNGTIIGIAGAPSDGKTYTGMRLGEILTRANNREFNPYLQIPFSQEHALWILDPDETPLEPGDVVVLDEAHFSASARDWFKEDNKEFISIIASARSFGLIVIVVVLHIDMIDKFLRKFTMAFFIHMERQGVSTTYKTYTPRFSPEMIKNRIGPLTLQLPWVSECKYPRCLTCKHGVKKQDICNLGRNVYERRKLKMQTEKIQTARETRKQKQAQKTDDDLIPLLREEWGKSIRTNVNVDATQADIRKAITNKYENYVPSGRQLKRLRLRLKAEHKNK